MSKLLTLAGQIIILTGVCAAQRGPLPSKLDHPWPMDHGDIARSGRSKYPGPINGVVEWKQKIAGGIAGIACDRNGHAIIGASFHQQWWSNELFTQSFNADGTFAWRIKVTPYDWGASQGVKSIPALDTAGNVVMNSGAGQLIKVSPTGQLLMTIQRTANFTNDSSPAWSSDGPIYHHQALALAKFSNTGTQLWSTSASSQTDVAVAPNGDCALGGVRTNEPHGSVDLSYFNANGTLRWSLGSTRGARTQVCFGPDGTLYATRGGTAAYNPDGSLKWSATPGGWGCALDGLGHVLTPQSSQIVAFNQSNGATAWTRVLPSGGSVVEGLTIDGASNIYAATSNGWIYGIRGNDGTIFYAVKAADTCTTQPALGAKRCIYVGATFAVNPYLYENYLVKVN